MNTPMRTLEIIQGLTLLITFYKEQAKLAFNQSVSVAPLMQNSIVSKDYLAVAHNLEAQLLNVKDDFLREARLIQSTTSNIIVAQSSNVARETVTVEATNTEAVKTIDESASEVVNTTEEVPADVAEMTEIVNAAQKTTSLVELLANNSIEKANLAEMWNNKRKDEAYARYDELFPGNTTAKAVKKQELSAISAQMETMKKHTEIKELGEKINDLAISTKSGITRPFAGQELIDRSANYLIDDKFNVLVLTGSDDENDTAAEDLIRLKAKQLMSAGNEQTAIACIQTLYAEKGMTKEMARSFLFKLIREDGNSELKASVMSLLAHGYIEKGDYHTMLSHCNNLVKFYSRSVVGKNETGDNIYKFWKDSKIQNFVDNCVNALVERGTFPKADNNKVLTEVIEEAEVVVDAETSIVAEQTTEEVVTTVEETVTAPVVVNAIAPEKKTNRQKKAEKFKAEREAKQAKKADVTLGVNTLVHEEPTSKEVVVVSPEPNIGPNLKAFNVNEVKNIYITNKVLDARAVKLLTSNGNWYDPFKLTIDLNKKALKKAEEAIISSLRDSDIDPFDFQIVNDKNEVCRFFRFILYTKNTEGVWVSPYGKEISTEALGQPIALEEITESKKLEASAQTALITETSSPLTTAVDAIPSVDTQEVTTQPEVIDVKDGVKSILHPSTKEFLAKGKKQIKAFIVKTNNGFNAFIQGVKEFRVENAKTSEEAQEALGQQVIDFSKRATDENDKVKASGKGKRISIPEFLKEGFENIEIVFGMKQTAKAV